MTERWHIMDFGLVQPEGHHWGTLAGLPVPETVELIRVERDRQAPTLTRGVQRLQAMSAPVASA